MADRLVSLPGRKPPIKMGPKGTGRINGTDAKTELELKREAQIEADAEWARRQSVVDEDEKERLIADKYDLVAMIANDPTCFPLEVAYWGVLLEMVRPKAKYGGVIEKTPAQIAAEEYLSKIGRVILLGPSAMEGATASGIKLKDLTATIKTPEQMIGAYVIQQLHTGQDVWFAPLPGKRLKLITTTEILAVTTNPTMFMKP